MELPGVQEPKPIPHTHKHRLHQAYMVTETPPPGKLEGFLRSTVYTYTQWPLIFLPPVILDKHKDTPLSIYFIATKAFSSCKQTFSSPFHFMVFLVSKHVSKHKALMMLDWTNPKPFFSSLRYERSLIVNMWINTVSVLTEGAYQLHSPLGHESVHHVHEFRHC